MTGVNGGSPSDRYEDAVAATEKLLQVYSGESADADPITLEFAHLVANKLGEAPIVPLGFVHMSELLLVDLKRGIDGYTGEPVESSLVGITDDEERKLRASVPALARAAFSSGFADDVENSMKEMGLIAPPESVGGEDLTEDEIITEDIVSIDQAYQKIIVDAREKVANLDWQNVGVSTEEIYQAFQAFYPMVLRNAPFAMPINYLSDQPGHQRGLLLELADSQKRFEHGSYWLAMTTDRIDAQFATFARDHLFLMMPDLISIYKGLDPRETLMYLAGEDIARSSMSRAATRIDAYKQDHPYRFREVN